MISKNHDKSIILTDADPQSRYRAVFEDDGRTGYAYLLKDKDVVSDVWLYNHGEPPSAPEWHDPSNAPFRNPKQYVKSECVMPANSPKDIRFIWDRGPNTNDIKVSIEIRGEICGQLKPHVKPGWARYALKDGPLARIMSDM
jgi:hypothetical protein